MNTRRPTVEVTVQHTSGQFSDSRRDHVHDAGVIFAHAVAADVWACTGTEAGAAPANHDLRDALRVAGEAHNFFVFTHRWGEWVALNRRFLDVIDTGFAGPYVDGTHGIPASQGAHAPRGLAWAAGTAKHHDLGRLTFGASHWLTHRSMLASGVTNAPLAEGAAEFGRTYGAGSGLVFLNADVNLDDARRDVFNGAPFVTLADELGRHPGTHEDTHRAIDVLASWDPDGRVVGRGYRVLDDAALPLESDHLALIGRYDVTVRR
jgi:hypothetical protein